VGLNELAELVEALPGFRDDPALVNERILFDIQITWYEEATDL
jgi:FeS assembly protein IscX